MRTSAMVLGVVGLALGVECAWGMGGFPGARTALVGDQREDERTFDQGDVDGDGDLDVVVTVFRVEGDLTRRSLILLRNDGNGVFETESWVTDGERPGPVKLGDVDGDGDLDAVIGQTAVSTLWGEVRWNDGSGDFSTSMTFEGGGLSFARGLDLADADGDGDLDMVVMAQGYRLWYFENSGDGSFVDMGWHQTNFGSEGAFFGDVDGDGLMDMVTFSPAFPGVPVFRGMGDGDFMPAQLVDVDEGAYSGDLIDVDGDGDPDLVMRLRQSEMIGVMLNDGGGSFGELTKYGVPDQLFSQVELSDQNGDGVLDLICSWRGFVQAYPGVGDGTFGERTDLFFRSSVGSEFGDFIPGDFDGDGLEGMLVYDDDVIVSIVQNSSSGYDAPDYYLVGDDEPLDLMLVDLDGNGSSDLVGATLAQGLPGLRVMLNNGDGTFAGVESYEIADHSLLVLEVQVGDLDGDGDPDVVVLMDSDWDVPSRVVVYLNDGSGGLFEPSGALLTGDFEHMAVGDMNEDGVLDLVLSRYVTRPWGAVEYYTSIYAGDGEGGYSFVSEISRDEPIRYGFQVVDLDGDGHLDVVGSRSHEPVWYSYGDGLGGLDRAGLHPIPTSQDSLVVVDLDGDGLKDLVSRGYVAWGDPAGGFYPEQLIDNRFGAQTRVVDLDGDGELDLVYPGSSNFGGIRVALGSGVERTFDVPERTWWVADSPSWFVAGDVDGDGRGDLIMSQHAFRFFEGLTVLEASVMVFQSEGDFFPPCPADLNGDRDLDFFDLSALLMGAVDYNGDTAFDFFDISAYLTDYSEGCP